ncbi:HTH_Tnp_Tc3_2 domain-containing protein [Trichonephila clavipes]|nr:HTH_Tnp_Tc3_2 domain-containing protein [Trichonephila clavipes]
MNLYGCCGWHVIKRKLFLSAVGEEKESFLSLLLRRLEKAIDLSIFDKGQIAMAQRVGMSVSETPRLLGCSLSAFVCIYAKRKNDFKTSSRRQAVGRLRAIEEKRCQKPSYLAKQNLR